MFDKGLLNNIGTTLKKNNHSIAIAESVTAGLLQAAFSNADKASLFFQGGITAYNVGQKTRHLLVEPLHAIECDSVSQKVAEDMSKNVCDMFLSNYGIGITGYAAKVPEKNIHELFAYYAICFNKKIIDSGKMNAQFEEGFPTQQFYVDEILKKFYDYLQHK